MLALVLGIGSFFLVTGDAPIGTTALVVLVYLNLAVLLLLGTAVAVRVVRVWAERRRGSAGASLHTRLVLLFGGVAVAPTIAVGILSGVLFTTGIQSWFADPVRLALDESMAASRAYLEEHQNAIRVDALGMAADINRAAPLLVQNRPLFDRIVQTQTTLRGLTEASVFDASTREVIAIGGLASASAPEEVPVWARIYAAGGDVAVMAGDENRVRALVRLELGPMTFLLIGRPVDPTVIGHMVRTEAAVGEYRRLEQRLSRLQISLAIIFAVVALLILAAAVLLGLLFAGAIARPVASLIFAAERVRTGDLSARVPEAGADDEIGSLTRAFNRMIGQQEANRGELMEAYRQIDERRRFTETVLAGVSAGVIGLDEHGRIDLANRSAATLLGSNLVLAAGRPLAEIVPEMAPLVAAALAAPDRPATQEIAIGPPTRRCTLIARIAAETEEAVGGRTWGGFVVTFDDVTELVLAQRKAAWADVARRIAHEIKNPLTPIQLSAERLKRKYLQRDHHRPGDLHGLHRHHRAPGRRYRPHGRRIQRLRAHAAAADRALRHGRCGAPGGIPSASGTSAHRLAGGRRRRQAGGGVRSAADGPGADQPAEERRRVGRGTPGARWWRGHHHHPHRAAGRFACGQCRGRWRGPARGRPRTPDRAVRAPANPREPALGWPLSRR